MTGERGDVPYPAWPIAEAHPERLAVAARLRGLEPRLPSGCSVLEVGCGAGGHLLPMAATFPDSRFVGVDLDARAVAAAADIARELGLANVVFHALDVRDALELLAGQRFDYATAHGVYSWIPDAARAALLELFGATLAEHGVAYVSYSSYPGFHVRQLLRDMLRYHATAGAGSREAVKQARELIEALLESPLAGPGASELLRRELAGLGAASDLRLAYDDLAEAEGFWLEDVAARAGGHGLGFLCDAASDAAITPFQGRAAEELEGLAGDPLAREAYLDLLSVRRFKRTLFCRAERRPSARKAPARLFGLHVSCPPHAPLPEANAQSWALPGTGGVVVAVREPGLRAALSKARRLWPEGVAVDDLDGASGADGRPNLGFLTALLRLHEADVVRLSLGRPTCVATPGKRPLASAYARACVRLGRPIASQHHEQIDLSERLRRLLALLDGARDHDELRRNLRSAAGSEVSALELHGDLEDLARNALLIG